MKNEYITIDLTNIAAWTGWGLKSTGVYTIRLLLILVAFAILGFTFSFLILELPMMWVNFFESLIDSFWISFYFVAVCSFVSGVQLVLVALWEAEAVYDLTTKIKTPTKPQAAHEPLMLPLPMEGATA